MKTLLILGLLTSVCVSDAEPSLEPSRYFIYDLNEVPFVKEKSLRLSRDDYEFEGLPDRVLKELETDEKADAEVTFRFLELPPESPYSRRDISILSIRRKGIIIYDASICPVHSVSMQLEDRKISYGLLAGPSREFYEAQARLFPYADRVVPGGCVVSDESRKIVPIFICGRCNESMQRYNESKTTPNQIPEPTPDGVAHR